MIPLYDDNPTQIRPYVTYGIVGLCVAVYLWQLSLTPQGAQLVAYALGFVPAVTLGDKLLPPELQWVPGGATLFTSMFLHGGLLHLGGNMLYLWIFGNNIEDVMGHARFVVFYLVCGVVAALAQGVPNPDSTIPMIGASGAIAGVLGAYLLLYPRAQVVIAIPLGFYLHMTRLPAVWVLGIWFGLQIFSSLGDSGDGAGVAWFAHIGGFAAGLLLIPLFKRRDVPLWQSPR